MGANAQTSVPAFTAGQVLTAQQQTEINTGIPVFATTTTRDAAFGGTGEKTLAEGQMAYIEATNLVQFYDGTAWQTIGGGLVPIIPTSVSVGSGTATVGTTGLITFTTVGTNLSINGCFSSLYSNYKIMFVSSNSASSGLTMRLRVAGTDSAATNYWAQLIYSNAGTPSADNNYTTSWGMAITGRPNRSFTGDFIDPFKTSQTSFLGSLTENNAGTNGGLSLLAHINTAATSYDGFSLIPSTGTFTGTLTIFGYNQ